MPAVRVNQCTVLVDPNAQRELPSVVWACMRVCPVMISAMTWTVRWRDLRVGGAGRFDGGSGRG